MRQIYCAKRLSEKYDTSVAGFGEDCLGGLKSADLQGFPELDAVVLPVLPLDGDGNLNTPCLGEKIQISTLVRLLKPNGIVLAGRPDSRLADLCDREIIDYMAREELNLLNAIPTAEGAVQIALEELPVTLSGLPVLVVGCGRIGTALVGILRGFGADVTVAVRSSRGAAKARIFGAKSCPTDAMQTDFGLVFNTAPAMIFGEELLKKFHRGTLFIDLASKPGGIDPEAAANHGIKAIWALGLPAGKTVPVTAGEIIADTVSGILEEKDGEADG